MSLRRTALLFLSIALAATPCSVASFRVLWAKKAGSQSKLFAFERDGRAGFIDPSGKIVIPPQIEAGIDDVGDFADGLARVDRQGYIDQTGRWIIKQDFALANDFSDGLAQVLVSEPGDTSLTSRFLDTSGSVAGNILTGSTGEFSEGLAWFEAKGKPGVRSLKPVVYIDYPGLKGFIDKTGAVAIKAEYADAGPFLEGVARVVLDGYCHIATLDGREDGSPTTGVPTSCGGRPPDANTPCRTGFIKLDGSFAIPPEFESAGDFHEGLAAVRVGGLWGFVDRTGTLAIRPSFEQVRWFQEGLASVRVGSKWGFIDTSGAVVIPPRFDKTTDFSDSLALVIAGGKSSYIDRAGRVTLGGPFREATPFVHGLAAILLSENHVAYIDKSGKHVFDYHRRQ